MRAGICRALTTTAFAAIAVAAASAAAAQERVTWTEQANVTVRGTTLEKTRGCDGCGDAGATSTQVIESTGGFVEFTVPDDWSYLVAGLSMRTRGTRFEDIDFGIRLNGNGSADIVENGRYIGGDTDYRGGDTFRIEVANDRVSYFRNRDLMATSRRRPSYPLAFDVGLGSVGASIADARIGGGRANDLARFDDRDDFRTLDRADRDDFRALDQNADGVITPREWRGDRRAFDDRDSNRDGRITRRELNAFSRFDDPRDDRDVVGTSGELIAVSARERWTDTGLTIRAGDSVTFDADGTIQMSGNRDDTANPGGARRAAPDALVRNSPAGTLIARIGNSAPFAVGQRRTIPRIPTSGRLYLSVNDDYLEDNEGEYRVSVTIAPR